MKTLTHYILFLQLALWVLMLCAAVFYGIKRNQMIPSLIYPKYLLTKLYSESNKEHKAKQIAEEILNSKVKVESSATREIINEMKKIISSKF